MTTALFFICVLYVLQPLCFEAEWVLTVKLLCRYLL